MGDLHRGNLLASGRGTTGAQKQNRDLELRSEVSHRRHIVVHPGFLVVDGAKQDALPLQGSRDLIPELPELHEQQCLLVSGGDVLDQAHDVVDFLAELGVAGHPASPGDLAGPDDLAVWRRLRAALDTAAVRVGVGPLA